MQFHKSLKRLIDSTSILQFSTKHDMKPSPSSDDSNTFDVVTRTTCNKMYTEEFNLHLENIVNEIVKESKELITKLGTHYQREILVIVIHVDRIQNHYFNNQQFKGIEETISGQDLFNNEIFELGMIDYGTIETRVETKEKFYMIILNQIERLKAELSELLFDEKQEVKPIKKLIWNVRPAVLAGLVHELDKKGWITPPIKKSDPNLSALADLLDEIFEYKGTRTTLYNALKDKNILSEAKRKEIILPKAESIS